MNRRPPALARRLLRILPDPHGRIVAADLEEEFTETVLPQRGPLRASIWFWDQTLRTVWAFRPRLPASTWPRPALPVLREVRHAYRGLRRRPGFALVAILTLAVGIGAAAAVFSVADAALFRPVPGVHRPEDMVTIRFQNDQDGSTTGVSLPTLRDLASAAPAAASIAGYQPFRFQIAGQGIQARTAWGHLVSGNYFDALGVTASRGRLFTREEADAPEGPRLAVVSDAFWRSALAGDLRAVGSSLRINGTNFTVVGVVAPDFKGVERLDSLEVWVPGSAYASLRHAESVPSWRLSNRAARFFNYAIARLAPGAAPEELESQLRLAMNRMVEAYPDDNGQYAANRPRVRADFGLGVRDRASLETTLRVLTALAAVILLVVCANVANLLVLQGLKRQGETALRRALGAARVHLAFLHLAEALLLALPAVGAGLGLTLLIHWVLKDTGIFPQGLSAHATVDARVFLFAAGTAVLTSVVFALVPYALAARQAPQTALKEARRTASRAATTLQGALSVAQLALSLALVGGALLLGRTVANLSDVELGFAPDQVLAFHFDPGPQGYDRAATSRFQRDLLDASGGIAGAEASAISGFVPFGRLVMPLTLTDPAEPGRTTSVLADWVTEDFFRVLDIPITAGRAMSRAEATPPAPSGGRAAVLSTTLARQLFGTPEQAVGRSLTAEAFGDQYVLKVVGVSGDIVDGSPRSENRPKVYAALPGAPQPWATLLIRTQRPLDAVAADVRAALARVDPNVPLTTAVRLHDQVANATARERTFVRLSTFLALLAMLLSGIGLYSVVAYAAAERRREFGIRLAVGASRVRITRLVVRRALGYGLVGVVGGLVLTRLGSRVIESLLFGVAPSDPLLLAVAAALLLIVSLTASVIPAINATRIDPAETLRVE